ncbi:fibulin-1-like, partial [Limulus polyphemus]|uniref:Fibulin-1-like n=1 Tax=Limulus polyphemus TaxID=6850 RepID=A0ABM1TKU3_LIMPO
FFPCYDYLDVDECEENLHACGPEEGQCHNTAGGYECKKQCSQGFIYNTFLHSCVDIDECTLGIHTCESRETCINTVGSFYCQSVTPSVCPPGFKPVPAVPGGIDSCLDVDECEENLHSCDFTTQECVNDHGSYHCAPKVPVPSCETGFVYDDDKQECVDINECNTGDHICTPGLHECLNTEGSYRCIVQCDEGFLPSLEGVCKDIDECAEGTDFCSSQGLQCINTPGSYRCKASSPPEYDCPPGYKYSQLFQNCTDINECVEKIDDCNLQTERCVNFVGGFRCAPKVTKCPHGFKRNEITNQCVDIDECQEGTDECIKEKDYCVNIVGSYQCQSKVIPPLRQCKSGFRLDHFTGECQEINECLEDSHSCLSNQRCVNIVGSYRCENIFTFLSPNLTTFVPPTVSTVDPRCEAGLRYDIRYQSCIDINECLEGSHKCSLNQTCVNTWMGYRCEKITTTSQPRITTSTSTTVVTEEKIEDIECSSGFHFSHQYRTCIDIDECKEQSPCDEQENCQNEVGSYSCVCKIGFDRSSPTEPCRDINECPLELHNCRVGQRCENTLGSFVCIRIQSCGTGYTLDSTTGKCEDDDECELGTHNCGRGYTCRNLEGSFRCQRTTCPRGQRLLSDGTCTIPSCGVGMEVNSAGYCVDINECQQNPDICETYQRCRNSIGSYYCEDKIRCGNGFEPNQYGTACNDINECEKGTHDCRPNQTCQNRRGGYSCECPKGYQQNVRRECEDINECVQYRNQVCAQNSDCENTPGSFNCHCKSGFRQSSDGRNCEDIDECKDTPGICQQNCRNTWGSYFCSCNVGYRLQSDNRACQDIDECEEWKGRGNLCIGFCVNEPGSYSCSCPSGYRLQEDERTCEDIDECQEENVCTGSDKVCINTRGDYRCHTINCPTNYERDTQHRSRCKLKVFNCRPGDAECLKEPLSYSYSFISLTSNFPIPKTGKLKFFTLRGPLIQSSTVEFSLELVDARTPSGIEPVQQNYFSLLRQSSQNKAVLMLVKSIQGPQEIELQLKMKMYHSGLFSGTAVARIFIHVSRYEF